MLQKESVLNFNVNELLREYWKGLFIFIVTPTFSWWSGLFEVVSEYVHGNTYELSRFIVIEFVLIIFLLISIIHRNYKEKCNQLDAARSKLGVIEIDNDAAYVLTALANLPNGNGHSAETLIEGQENVHLQEAQYHLDKLESAKLIEHTDMYGDEKLYNLSISGRAFVVENGLLQG